MKIFVSEHPIEFRSGGEGFQHSPPCYYVPAQNGEWTAIHWEGEEQFKSMARADVMARELTDYDTSQAIVRSNDFEATYQDETGRRMIRRLVPGDIMESVELDSEGVTFTLAGQRMTVSDKVFAQSAVSRKTSNCPPITIPVRKS